MSPNSIVGIVGALLPPARLFFPFDDSSKLILIIRIQSSSKPSPRLRLVGPDSAPPTRLLGRLSAEPPAEMDSKIPPARKPFAAVLPPPPAPLPSRRPKNFSLFFRPPRSPGKSRT